MSDDKNHNVSSIAESLLLNLASVIYSVDNSAVQGGFFKKIFNRSTAC
jgi:hypothetical protein